MRRFICTVFLAGLALVLSGGLLRLIVPKPLLLENVPYSQAIYDRQGKLLRLTLAADQAYRLPIKLEEISPQFIEATLLYEDRSFAWHPGVNLWGLLKAAVGRLGGGRKSGGSTLTMQLAKIRYGMKTKTYWGKLRQIGRALQLELFYSKKEILQAYLILAPYGGNVEGISAASLIYYGCSPRELTLEQALVLSIIPQNPVHRLLDAQVPQNLEPELRTMRALWLAHHTRAGAALVDLEMPMAARARTFLPHRAMHFTEMIRHEIGETGAIQTTLNLDWQLAVEERVSQYIQQKAKSKLNNASVLLLDYTTMETLVWVGSADFWNQELPGECDGVTMHRSPGSALKPFIYALALEQGIIHPQTHLLDGPISFGDYDPENFDRQFLGPIPAREALRQSRNVPAILLEAQLKGRNLYTLLQEAGVEGLKEESSYGLALALGDAEISPEKVASLYAMLANRGEDKPLRFLFQQSAANTSEPLVKNLLSPEASFVTLDMLRSDLRPSGTGALPMAAPVAWKTGTSHGFRDAWCAGVFDHYVLVVWLGDFRGRGNAALVGRQAAAPLFFSIVDCIRARAPHPLDSPWTSTKGLQIQTEAIDPETGFLAGADCPHQIKDWFIPGVSPIRQGTPCLSSPNEGAMQITSPRCFQDFLLKTPSPENEDSLALEARDEGSGHKLIWFANHALIATTKQGETTWWKPTAGNYTLEVMDEKGRMAERKLTVTIRD